LLNEGLLVWQASRREGGDGVLALGERAIRLPNPPVADVRLHDQLHQQAETTTREIHDEQCSGTFYDPSGENLMENE
jgi:hypothetical protein